MSSYEVEQPILNPPYDEPAEHWYIDEGKPPERRPGRRPAGYFYRDPTAPPTEGEHEARGRWVDLALVNRIRERLQEWRPLVLRGEGGVTRTTHALLTYWRRDGREHRLFFAQLEAAETIIFLSEARADFLQGIAIPLDEPGDERKAEGYTAFRRYACKMATGSGKRPSWACWPPGASSTRSMTAVMPAFRTSCWSSAPTSPSATGCKNSTPLLSRSLRDTLLPGARRAGDQPHLPLGGERFWPHRRHRIGACENSAAGRA